MRCCGFRLWLVTIFILLGSKTGDGATTEGRVGKREEGGAGQKKRGGARRNLSTPSQKDESRNRAGGCGETTFTLKRTLTNMQG